MSLTSYRNALYVVNGDVLKLMIDGYSLSNIDPTSLKKKLIKSLSNLRYWQWDPFNFNYANVADASITEAINRVVENPESDDSIPNPGIGFVVTKESDGKYEYEIIAKYSDKDSYVTNRIEHKFKITPKNSTENDGVHITKYDLFKE